MFPQAFGLCWGFIKNSFKMKNARMLVILLFTAQIWMACEKKDHMQNDRLPADTLCLSDAHRIMGSSVYEFWIYEDLELYIDCTLPGHPVYQWMPGGETTPVIRFVPNTYRKEEYFFGITHGSFEGALDLNVDFGDTLFSYAFYVLKFPSAVYCPDAFTPNGDGRNDIWQPKTSHALTIDELAIYDMNASLMFRAEGNQPKSWDGKYHGELCGKGWYYYYVHYSYPAGTTGSVEGMLNLIR